MNLYIKINDIWYEPDIDTKENNITLDYVFDSLENPTKYTSEMSYTGFILPITPKNNKIFDNLNIVDNTVKYSPLENIEYILISDGDTISSGTCYVESIDEKNYNLSVNGSLYNIFSKLLNSGFRSDINDTEYYQIKELWKNIYLTPSTVNACWNIGDNEIFNLALIPKLDVLRMSNTVGFMPTTFTDMGDFATDKWVNNNDITEIGYGDLSMQQIAEFRVNKLKPYIYVDKLFQIYRNECKQITDYELILDERWFNETNEHLRNVVYVLPSLNDKSISKTNQFHTTISNTSNMNYDYSNFVNLNETIVSPYTTTVSSPNQGMFEYQIPLQVKIPYNTLPNNLVYCWNPYLFLVVNVKVLNDENTEYLNKKIAYILEPAYKDGNGNYKFTFSNYIITLVSNFADEVQRLRVGPTITFNGNETYFDFGSIYNQIFLTDLDNAHLELNIQVGKITIGSNPTNSPIAHIMTDGGIYQVNDYRFLNVTFESDVLINNSLTINNGSGSRITLERLFQSELPFNVLLKYSKLLGLFWLVDDYNKTVTVIRRSDYFYDCFFSDLSNKGSNDIYPYTGFYDITDLVDFTSFNEYPLSWNSRKVSLNFNEADNQYSKEYKEKYGMTFGSVVINTNNETSLTTENLLCTNDSDTINAPIFSNEWIRPFKSYQSNRVYKVEDDTYLIDNDNLFMYRLSNGVYNTDIRDGYRVDDNGDAYIILSSDSTLEQQRNVFCYHSEAIENDLITTVRPRFSEANNNGYSLLFAKPYEYYTIDFPTNFIGLYESEYSDYFSEVYNANNKTLKVSALISGLLYNRLKTVPLVVIGNISYIILEISGWSAYDYCTLTLRQINNIEMLYKKNKVQTKLINGVVEM